MPSAVKMETTLRIPDDLRDRIMRINTAMLRDRHLRTLGVKKAALLRFVLSRGVEALEHELGLPTE